MYHKQEMLSQFEGSMKFYHVGLDIFNNLLFSFNHMKDFNVTS